MPSVQDTNRNGCKVIFNLSRHMKQRNMDYLPITMTPHFFQVGMLAMFPPNPRKVGGLAGVAAAAAAAAGDALVRGGRPMMSKSQKCFATFVQPCDLACTTKGKDSKGES